MRVCLVGDAGWPPAEGMRNVLQGLMQGLRMRVEVMSVDGRDLGHGRGWTKIRRFHPHVVHYVAGPSLASFLLTRTVAASVPGSASVVSCLHPTRLGRGRMVRWFKPDLVLTQAHDSELLFTSWGLKTAFVPNGVDTRRFRPVKGEIKQELRGQYGVSSSKRVILHVGHLKPGRNILALTRIQTAATQVIVVGSPATRAEQQVKAALQRSGVLVWERFLPKIEEVYQLSDVYAFPTVSRMDCIETPLSVLEAVACGLGVVSTRFGALPRVFQEGAHFRYVSSAAEIPEALEAVTPRLAGRVEPEVPDWTVVGERVLRAYAQLGLPVTDRRGMEGQAGQLGWAASRSGSASR